MKNPTGRIILFLIILLFIATSCKRTVYVVSVQEIDSIIQSQGSVIIELREGYHVYPLLDKNDKPYRAGESLRPIGETGNDGFLEYFGAQATPAYASEKSGAFVCPKYCAIQVTK